MEIKSFDLRHLSAAACAVLFLGACDAGTGVDESAELETGTDTTIAETEPMEPEPMTEGESPFAAATLAGLDTDMDQQVSRDEFDTWFDQQVWSDLDTDTNDQVAQTEYADTFWGWWDADGDDAVSQEEYQHGRETFAFAEVDYPDFAEAAGDDQRWTRDEFDTWFQESLWTGWDTDSDQQITRQEAADAWWQLWDENGDDHLDQQEIARFGTHADMTTAERGETAVGYDAS
jgi:hypothetical protein